MSRYIFVILMDIPVEHEDDFNRIYDTDHLTHMMQVEGNLRCDRYRLEWSDNADMQKYLAIYEITDPELPRSPAWKAQSELGEWAGRMRNLVQNRRNGVFREIAEHKAPGVDPQAEPVRDIVYFLQQAIPAELEDRFNLLYDTDHIPLMLQTPGARDCRRFRLEWSGTGNVPDYLAIYGIDAPLLPRSDAWKAQTDKGRWPIEMRPNFTVRRNGGYSRIAEHGPA